MIRKRQHTDHMPARSRALEAEVIPAWRSFLRGLLQGPEARRLLAEGLAEQYYGFDTGDVANNARTRTVEARVRGWAKAGSMHYPTPAMTWEIARALRHRVGHRFCHGPLVLYAAGHLHDFVRVMVLAEIDHSHKQIPISVIDDVIASATDPVDSASRRVTHIHLSISEKTRDARSFWEDDHSRGDAFVEAAYESAWLSLRADNPMPEQHDIRAALLAATNHAAPLAERRAVIQRSLLRYLDHLDRLEFAAKGWDPWQMPERIDGYEDALDRY